MNKEESRELVEEAIENGYIDYTINGLVCLNYKEYEFWLLYKGDIAFTQSDEDRINIFYSEELYDKLKSMFKAWEAI